MAKIKVLGGNYDEYGRVTNKLDQVSAEILRYKYDPDSRLTNRWSTAKGNTYYTYDPVGNLTNVNYPTSDDVTFMYDALNRVSSMVDAAGATTYGYGPNLFTFVRNNSMSAVDPFGLKLWMCTRLILGGAATRAFIWDDRNIDDYASPNDPTRSCGQGSSFGLGTWGTYSKQDKGPPHDFEGEQWKDGKVTCKPIKNSDGKEGEVRKCCTNTKKINDGPWFPFVRDCHNQAVDCLKEGGIDPNDIPSHPRLPQYPLKTPPGRHGESR